MPRSNSNSFDVVEPGDPSEHAAHALAVSRIREAGWDALDAQWLADLFLLELPGCGSTASKLSERMEANIMVLASSRSLAHPQFGQSLTESQSFGDRDTALLITLAALAGCIWNPSIVIPTDDGDNVHWSAPPDRLTAILSIMRDRGADFEHALRQGWPRSLRSEWAAEADAGRGSLATFMRLLLGSKMISLRNVVDVDRLRRIGSSGRWWPGSIIGSEDSESTWDDPRNLRTWIRQVGVDALAAVVPVLAEEPDETVVALITGIAHESVSRYAHSEFGCTIEMFGGITPEWREPMREFGLAMLPCFAELDLRLQKLGQEAGDELRTAWMLLFRMAWDARAEDCPADTRRRILAAATEDLSRIRPILRNTGSSDDNSAASDYRSRAAHVRRCGYLLAYHGGLWRCMKPLLLALRALQTPALARDLRHWDEFMDDRPPTPWNEIPGLLSQSFHLYAGHEQEKDPDLHHLRTSLASYLLERLKDRPEHRKRPEGRATDGPRSDEHMVEPMPEWRYCMIRAVSELKINPEGRGHRTLHWSSQHDPHPRVQEAARSAYQTLRHRPSLAAGDSPRRTVMSALWWLKQAHMLGLGIQPDPDGAQRTRAKELTRTKEVERNDNPDHI